MRERRLGLLSVLLTIATFFPPATRAATLTIAGAAVNPQEGTGTVTFSSEPEGAEIYVDGRFMGSTPSTLKLAVGSHAIEMKSHGRRTWRRELEVWRDSEVRVRSTLEPEGPGQSAQLEKPPPASAKPLSQIQVLTLLAGAVSTQRVAYLVGQRGINFEPTEDYLANLQVAGADESALKAVRAAKVVKASDSREVASANRAQAELHFTRGLAFGKKQSYGQAEAELRVAIQLDPGNPHTHYLLGYYLYQEKKTDPSIAEYREALRLQPDYADAHYSLGLILADQKHDPNGAISEYRQALSLDPDDADAHNNLGVSLADLGRSEEALAEYREAIRLNPDYAIAHLNIGAELYRRNDLDAGIAQFRKAVSLDPKNALAHANLGRALVDKRDSEGAIAELRSALTLQPDLVQAHTGLGLALAQEGNNDEAATEEFRTALRLQPGSPEARTGLAVVLLLRAQELIKKGDLEAGIAQLRSALEHKPDYAEAHKSLGIALAMKGDRGAAITEFSQALRLNANLAEAHAGLGAVLLQNGKLDEAETELREALRLQPEAAWAHQGLGALLEKKGDRKGALEQFRIAVELAPNDPNIRAAYERLSGNAGPSPAQKP